MGIVYRKSLQSYVVDVKQHSARNIMLTFSMHAGRLDIISTYAPQACHEDPSASDTHYAELDTLLDEHYAFSPRLILGDFNARIIKALPSESEVVGPYTLGASLADLDCLSQAQQDNRSRFIEFCLARNMVVKNTFFQKSDEQLVAYKSVGVKSWHPPWQLHKYAQMDVVLINQKWKNAVENIYTTAVHTVDTDHKLMIAEVKFKLKAKTMNSPVSHIKYRTPSPQELIDYNHAVSTRLAHISADASAEGLTLTSFNQILSDSAKVALTRLPPKQKKPYISATTWQLLESKWSAVESNNTELADALSAQIKDQVRKDKEDHLLSQLEEITSQGYKWDGLKRLRAKFTPSFTRFKDSSGNHVPHTDYPHKADYLQHTQWKHSSEQHMQETRINCPLQDGRYRIDDSPFTTAELHYVLSRIKSNKTPGHDGVPGELLKWLDAENRNALLEAANACLENGSMDQELMKAIVVSIYKKGDASSLANYRPISLLCSCYKIVAALVKERLDAGLDSWLMQTQFGFRKSNQLVKQYLLPEDCRTSQKNPNSAAP